ncbi:MAG: Rab family GTPase [Candidatus Heimdallarchaeota archaeon]
MDEKKASDFLWKIVLCGDSFVGKTTIRKRAMGEHFAEEYISTVGADFSSYKIRLGDLTIGFQVWDLAGQDKYKYIRSSFYGGATGCFLVYDVTNPRSLSDLSAWVDEAIRYSNGTIEIFVICGNKIDLKDRREISKDKGEKFVAALKESSGLQVEYIETSALTGENIDIAFDMMAKCLLEREGISPVKPKDELIDLPVSTPSLDTFTEDVVKTDKDVVETSTFEKIAKSTETISTMQRSAMIEDDNGEETEKLIAEVLTVLNETDEVIIGRETTKDGERAITVTKEAIEKEPFEEEKEPIITPRLERVLQQINIKLESLAERLDGLEEEITHVKENDYDEEEHEEVKENIADLRDELEVLTTVEPIEDEVSEKELESDQTILESLFDDDDDDDDKKVVIEEPDRALDELTTEVIEEEETETAEDDLLNELVVLEKEELVELPDEDPLLPVDENNSSEGYIGTELGSAMISELKDISEEEEPEEKVNTVKQPLLVEDKEEKKNCHICGEPLKFIRQYNKFYCTKCGRYLI